MNSRRLHAAHREGFKQGLWTALLVASPFIVAGVRWMYDHADPMVDRVKGVKNSDMYTRFFDKETHQDKEATRKLDKFRSGEGNYGDHDVEVSSEEDAELFNIIKEIAKKELSKEK